MKVIFHCQGYEIILLFHRTETKWKMPTLSKAYLQILHLNAK